MVYLTIPLELVEQRIVQGRGEARNLFEKIDYLKKVKANFDAMAFDFVRRVDGTRPPGAVREEIYALAQETIGPAIVV